MQVIWSGSDPRDRKRARRESSRLVTTVGTWGSALCGSSGDSVGLASKSSCLRGAGAGVFIQQVPLVIS